ncbi:MAG: hypothetical protein HND47_04280 [Chloroflexi bacterium]|nr:hypothetical protein [Chloroflexota bacterium]
MPVITFNGKTYNHPDEMPANERQAYEQMMRIFVDENGNGIPDFLEGDVVQNVLSAYSTKIDVDGKTIHTLDDLPPDLRQSVDAAFKLLSNTGILPGDFAAQTSQASREPQFESKPFMPQGSPVMQEDKGPGIFLWVILGIVLCFALAAAAVAAFYFMGR